MFKMLSQLWAAFTVLFTAFEKVANSINLAMDVAEKGAQTMSDEAGIKREIALVQLQADLAAARLLSANKSTQLVTTE